MAINIKGTPPKTSPAQTNLDGIGGSAGSNDATQSATEGQQAEQGATPPQTQTSAPSGGGVQAPGHQSGASFLMTGGQQNTQVQQVKATQDLRAKLRGGAREFWLNPGEFAKLYFLDGKLLSDNVFDTPMVNTHMLQIGGQWAKFVCNQHTEGQCIVCQSNVDGSRVDTMQLFTVINIMPYVIQNGPRKGQTLPARLQLFAANMRTREKLMKRAQNHNGVLAGSIYQMSRSDKQSSRTGDDIEYIQEVPMAGVLQKYPKLGTTQNAKGDWVDAPTTVYDYAKVYPVVTNAEIAQMRPDIASAAGFSAYNPTPGTGQPATGFGSDPTAAMDDAIPF